MANTKDIKDRAERKKAKRTQRKALKETLVGLSTKEHKRFRKSETVGLRAWMAEQKSAE
jgi:hypothetical protein